MLVLCAPDPLVTGYKDFFMFYKNMLIHLKNATVALFPFVTGNM